jgi:hypothetical protein
MDLRRHQAGRSAQRKSAELRRSWLRRANVRKFRRTCLTIACCCFAIAFMPSAGEHIRLFGAATAGAFATLWVVVADLSTAAERYARGADGERRTEDAVRSLRRDGWVVRHDLDGRYGNIDHVVVGPPGIFLLDSKALRGTVTVESSGSLVVEPEDGRPWRWDTIDGRTRGAAAGLHSTLAGHLGRSGFRVFPVVVIWASFEARAVDAKGVSFVHGAELEKWLRNQRPRYTPGEIAAFGQALAQVPRFHERARAS